MLMLRHHYSAATTFRDEDRFTSLATRCYLLSMSNFDTLPVQLRAHVGMSLTLASVLFSVLSSFHTFTIAFCCAVKLVCKTLILLALSACQNSTAARQVV